MSNWIAVMLIVYVFLGVSLCGLILIQQGKGADMGAVFGGGASGSIFGATGSANFLSRTTAVLATLFFILTLALTITSSRAPKAQSSVMEVPAAPVHVPLEPAKNEATPTLPLSAPATPPANQGAAEKPANNSPAKEIPK